jgi:hypothetical protein
VFVLLPLPLWPKAFDPYCNAYVTTDHHVEPVSLICSRIALVVSVLPAVPLANSVAETCLQGRVG